MNTANDILAKILGDIARVENERIEREAKESPKAYRDCKVMERGKDTGYQFFLSATSTKRKQVRFCYASHRNVAGYYLTWTETIKHKMVRRTNFHGHETKADAIADCRWRSAESRKPVSERKIKL